MTVGDFDLQSIETELGIVGLRMECPDLECQWWCSFLFATMEFIEEQAQRHIWERHGGTLEDPTPRSKDQKEGDHQC